MQVSFNVGTNVAAYYKGYDLSAVADTLLDMYDFTALPPMLEEGRVQFTINVNNEAYIALYKTLGPRSKKVSLGRLFEFGYNMCVLDMPRFNALRLTSVAHDDPVPFLLNKVYKTLLDIRKYDDSETIKTLIECVREYQNTKGISDGTSK